MAESAVDYNLDYKDDSKGKNDEIYQNVAGSVFDAGPLDVLYSLSAGVQEFFRKFLKPVNTAHEKRKEMSGLNMP